MMKIYIKHIIQLTLVVCLFSTKGISQETLSPYSQKKKSRIIQKATREIEKSNFFKADGMCEKYKQSNLNLDTNDIDYQYIRGRVYLGLYVTTKSDNNETLLYRSAEIFSKIDCYQFSDQQLLDLNLDQSSCREYISTNINLKLTEELIKHGKRDNNTKKLAINLPCEKTIEFVSIINYSLGEKEFHNLIADNNLILGSLREINKSYPEFSRSKVYQNKFHSLLNDSITKAKIRLEKDFKEASNSLRLLRKFKNENPKFSIENNLVIETFEKLYQDSVTMKIKKLQKEFKDASNSLFLLRNFRNENPKFYADTKIVSRTYEKLYRDSLTNATKILEDKLNKSANSLALMRELKKEYPTVFQNNEKVVLIFTRLYQDSIKQKLLAIQKLELKRRKRELDKLLKTTSFDYRKEKYTFKSSLLKDGLRIVSYQDKDLNVISKDVFKDDLLISSYNFNNKGVLNGPFFNRIKLDYSNYFDISNKEKPRLGLVNYNGEYCEISKVPKEMLVSKGYYQNGVLSSNKYIVKIEDNYDWAFDEAIIYCETERYVDRKVIVATCAVYDGKIEGDLEYYKYTENKRDKNYNQIYPILDYDYTAVKFNKLGPTISFKDGVVLDGWKYIGKGKSYFFRNGNILGYKKYSNNSNSGPVSDSMVLTEDIWIVDGVFVKKEQQAPWLIQNSSVNIYIDSVTEIRINKRHEKTEFNLYIKSYLNNDIGIPQFHKMDIQIRSYKPTEISKETWFTWWAYAYLDNDNKDLLNLNLNSSENTRLHDLYLRKDGVYQFPIMNYQQRLGFTD